MMVHISNLRAKVEDDPARPSTSRPSGVWGTSLKGRKGRRSSLVVFCAWHFAVYALLLVGVYGLFHTLVNQRLTEAFFSLDDLLQYQTALAAEDYGSIPLRGRERLLPDL